MPLQLVENLSKVIADTEMPRRAKRGDTVSPWNAQVRRISWVPWGGRPVLIDNGVLVP